MARERPTGEMLEMQTMLWRLLKDRRDETAQAAELAQRDLDYAMKRGWHNHLPTLEEARAAWRGESLPPHDPPAPSDAQADNGDPERQGDVGG